MKYLVAQYDYDDAQYFTVECRGNLISDLEKICLFTVLAKGNFSTSAKPLDVISYLKPQKIYTREEIAKDWTRMQKAKESLKSIMFSGTIDPSYYMNKEQYVHYRLLENRTARSWNSKIEKIIRGLK